MSIYYKTIRPYVYNRIVYQITIILTSADWTTSGSELAAPTIQSLVPAVSCITPEMRQKLKLCEFKDALSRDYGNHSIRKHVMKPILARIQLHIYNFFYTVCNWLSVSPAGSAWEVTDYCIVSCVHLKWLAKDWLSVNGP